jgi:hypothetical protein
MGGLMQLVAYGAQDVYISSYNEDKYYNNNTLDNTLLDNTFKNNNIYFEKICDLLISAYKQNNLTKNIKEYLGQYFNIKINRYL